MEFKKGDIVYFKSDFIQSIILNNEINSNYQTYTHYRNQPYKIIDEYGQIYGSIIQNLSDNKMFYVGIQMKNYIIHKSEWKQTNREIIINSLLT